LIVAMWTVRYGRSMLQLCSAASLIHHAGCLCHTELVYLFNDWIVAERGQKVLRKAELNTPRDKSEFLYLNLGHFLDHFFMLIFASAAALRLATEWGMTYAELIPYATPGFIAFGVCAIPAGWLADKWSREGMMAIFFVGIGLSSIFAGMASNPIQIAVGLTAIGIFAAIYHPVGLAMVVQGKTKTGVLLAVNGVWGNLGVASAALLTGFLIDLSGWRSAFYLIGVLSVGIGIAYWRFIKKNPATPVEKMIKNSSTASAGSGSLVRIFAIILITTAIGGLVFQSTTFALPKVLSERLTDLSTSATLAGWYAFLVFSIAAGGQLVVGTLIDRFSVRTVFAIVAALQAILFTVMMHLTGTLALLVSIAFMLVVFGQIPINDVLLGRVVQSEWRSRAYALRYLVTFSVMASAVPLIAWIHSHWGFDRLFAVLAVAAACIFLAVLMLPKTTNKNLAE